MHVAAHKGSACNQPPVPGAPLLPPHGPQNPELRQALRRLRDVPRCPEGATPAPDLVSVLQGALEQQGGGGAGAAAGSGEGQDSRAAGGAGAFAGVVGALRRLGVEGTVGAVVKAGARVAIEAAGRV